MPIGMYHAEAKPRRVLCLFATNPKATKSTNEAFIFNDDVLQAIATSGASLEHFQKTARKTPRLIKPVDLRTNVEV